MKLRLAPTPAGSRPFDFVAIGESSLDLLCVCESFPVADSKTKLLRRLDLPGGQAATAAVACARLGLKSRYAGAIGDDAAGDTVCRALERDGVDVRVVVRRGVETRSAVILIDQFSGRRSVLASRDDRLNVGAGEFDDAVWTDGRVLLVDGSDIGLSRRAAAVARARGVRTLVDLDTPTADALELLKLIDIVIVPAGFVRVATGHPEIGAGLAAMAAESGASAVVATAGEEGATAWCDGAVVHADAVKTEVIDTTGAGDAFRAGFAAAWLSAGADAPDLIEMLRFAAQVAALNCRAFGAQRGLPTADELQWPASSGGVTGHAG